MTREDLLVAYKADTVSAVARDCCLSEDMAEMTIDALAEEPGSVVDASMLMCEAVHEYQSQFLADVLIAIATHSSSIHDLADEEAFFWRVMRCLPEEFLGQMLDCLHLEVGDAIVDNLGDRLPDDEESEQYVVNATNAAWAWIINTRDAHKATA